jgi:hypothetical protein
VADLNWKFLLVALSVDQKIDSENSKFEALKLFSELYKPISFQTVPKNKKSKANHITLTPKLSKTKHPHLQRNLTKQPTN